MPNIEPKTLEEARAALLEQQNQITQLTQERDNLQQEITTRTEEIETLRTLNQKFFLQLSQGSEPDPEPEPDPVSLDDALDKMKGVIRV